MTLRQITSTSLALAALLAGASAHAAVGEGAAKPTVVDTSAADEALDPRPIVNRMTEAIDEIQKILDQQKPTNDKLVIRCVEEKLAVAHKSRAEALASIPGLKKQLNLTQAELATATPGLRSPSPATGSAGQKPETGLSPEKTVMGAAEAVERQLTAARLCSRIHSGEVVMYNEGTNPAVAGDAGGEIDIPDFANIDRIPVQPPVSRVD